MGLCQLPIEVLNLILLEIKRNDFQELCSIRLVCQFLATAVEPLAFNTVKIVPYSNPRFVPQVQYLASDGTPNSRWTTILEIDQGGHGGRISSKDRAEVKPPEMEETYLIPAIEALRGVKRVEYGLYPKHPYDGAFKALSRLPFLNELKITFHFGNGGTFRDVSLPSYPFPNLRVLDLENIKLVPSIVDSLKPVLKQVSSTLESLSVQPSVWHNGCMDYDEIAVVALDDLLPPSLPRLTSLSINTDRFSVSASCIDIFPSISHLDLDQAASLNVSPAFWGALEDKGVRLKRLSVYPLTTPIIRYLQSYTGLEELRLCEPSYAIRRRKPFKDTNSSKAFGEVLAMHKRTLRRLSFEDLEWKQYGITEERLQGILECKELESLWLVYHFPSQSKEYDEEEDGNDVEPEEGESSDDGERDGEADMGGLRTNMDMILLLSSVSSNLPRLRKLTLEAKRKIPNLGWCGNAYMSYTTNMVVAFAKIIREAKATVEAAEPANENGTVSQEGRTRKRCGFQIECRPLHGWDPRPIII
ncbi:hypothetical protein NMY22_g6321 [Coprinellus aureogranulatus]|nr:hypothetical protein NMY22_g6321 [Coprinellus aureogranulatus]